ncbi:MAG: tyrosine-type recombinase/integrase [Solirubrobacterales bacterium]
MPRPATGTIVEPKSPGESWALRIPAYGDRHYVTLGTTDQGWNWKKADEERANIMADVRRGIWVPPEAEAPAPEPDGLEDPTYHEWAETWFEDEEPGLKPLSARDYKWALELHLLPYFGQMRLSDITIEKVDEYRAFKQRQKRKFEAEGKKDGLGNNQINKTITRLAQTLKRPVEYPRYKIASNAALGPDRKAKREKPKRTWLQVEQITTFVESADSFMRPLVSVLVGCGLRIGEALALDWRDINLSTATIHMGESKTETGEDREVDIPLGALEELIAWKARSPRAKPGDPVFLSGRLRKSYARQTTRNAEARFKTIIEKTNEKLREAGIEIIEHITPHGLRRTYASLRAAAGDDPVYIAEQGGWADPRFVFSVYQKAARRRGKLDGRYLVAFDAALSWARFGRNRQEEGPMDISADESIQRVSQES